MLSDRNKRELIGEFEPETVLDLLNKLPKRLLEQIVETYGLKPVKNDKHNLMLIITANRKIIFRSVKFSFTYVKHNTTPKERDSDSNVGD